MGNACKLIVSDHQIIFANAGPLGDGEVHFIDVARDVLRKTDNLSEAAARFDDIVRPRLEHLAKQTKASNPKYFLAKVDGKPWYQVVFARFTSSGPEATLTTYRTSQGSSGLVINPEPSSCFATTCLSYFAIGLFDNMNYAMAKPERLPKGNVVEIIKYLIELEIAADPKHVGPPIAVVTTDSAHSQWIENGECNKQ
jgi:hypothetical protein